MRILLFFCLWVLTLADNSTIHQLPFCTLPNCTLGTQHAGYISIDKNSTVKHHFFYWFVPSYSTSPSKDVPLVLWLNGGPGCSSVAMGYFQEQGPLHFKKGIETKFPQHLHNNPWSWVHAAHVLFIESPVGVGFSYADDGNVTTSDTQTAEENHAFLRKWFTLYPQYKTNEFWITGESYAGIYVPTLAKLVAADTTINFKGVMVGNGVTIQDNQLSAEATVKFQYYHALINETVYTMFTSECGGKAFNSTSCQKVQALIGGQTAGYQSYAVYSDCYTFPSFAELQGKPVDIILACDGSWTVNWYLNQPEVQSAIHALRDGKPVKYTPCSNPVHGAYVHDQYSMLPIYESLLATNHKVLIYSGDTDSVVPYTYTLSWLKQLNSRVVVGWQPWHYNDTNGAQIGGRYSQYENGLTFMTIKGAGHEVPAYRPHQAFIMFSNFINNKPSQLLRL